MKEKGMTIVELIIVIAIIGVLISSLGYSYDGWMTKYSIESTTKELYSDLMNARARATYMSLDHYAVLSGGSYSIVEDTNDNSVYDPGVDGTLPGFPKRVAHPLDWNDKHIVSKIIFDKRGHMEELRTIWVTSSSAPDYNCMKVSKTRIIMGWYTGGECYAK